MSDITDDRADSRRALEEYANTSSQPLSRPPYGRSLGAQQMPPELVGAGGIAERILTTQQLPPRNLQKILHDISLIAKSRGNDYYYRFPVRDRKAGTTSYIEGPTIKLANDVHRLYGKFLVETRVVDQGESWIFYIRGFDTETHSLMERAYQQRKSQVSIDSKDYARQQDIAFQIGQSKAIRGLICNALQSVTDYAFEEAKSSLVEKIGKDLDGWRQRTLEGLQNMPMDVRRAERAVGRAASAWIVSDIAQLIAMMRAVADGMATADETFPLLPAEQKPEDKSAEASTAPQETASAGPTDSETEGEQLSRDADAGKEHLTKVQPPTAKAETKAEQAQNKTTAKNFSEYLDLVSATCQATSDPDTLRSWFASDAQRRLRNGIGLVSEQTNEARKIVEARVRDMRRENNE